MCKKNRIKIIKIENFNFIDKLRKKKKQFKKIRPTTEMIQH